MGALVWGWTGVVEGMALGAEFHWRQIRGLNCLSLRMSLSLKERRLGLAACFCRPDVADVVLEFGDGVVDGGWI